MAALAMQTEEVQVDFGVFMTGDALVRRHLQVGVADLEGGGQQVQRTFSLRHLGGKLPIGVADELHHLGNLVIAEHAAFVHMPGSHLGAVGGAGDGLEEQFGVHLRQGGVVEGRHGAHPLAGIAMALAAVVGVDVGAGGDGLLALVRHRLSHATLLPQDIPGEGGDDDEQGYQTESVVTVHGAPASSRLTGR